MRIAGALVCLVAIAASANAQIVERQVIVQGSVGQPGRETAFLKLQNLEDLPVIMTVLFVNEDPSQSTAKTYTLQPYQRRSINLALDVPELGTRANFSVIAYTDAEDGLRAATAMDLTWYRAQDGHEVETLKSVTRQSPKR